MESDIDRPVEQYWAYITFCGGLRVRLRWSSCVLYHIGEKQPNTIVALVLPISSATPAEPLTVLLVGFHRFVAAFRWQVQTTVGWQRPLWPMQPMQLEIQMHHWTQPEALTLMMSIT